MTITPPQPLIRFVAIVSGFFVVIASVLVVLEVVLRYGFNSPRSGPPS